MNKLNTPTALAGPLPCPWCGGNAGCIRHIPMDAWMVSCQRVVCLAKGPAVDSEAEAIAAWNRVAARIRAEIDR